MLKLRYSPTSPFARKVVILAKETGLAPKIEIVQTNPFENNSDIGKDNPLNKVPALILENGEVLYDSPVICEYLDGLHSGRKFFPAAGPERWTALRRQALADGIMDAAVLRRLEVMRPAEQQSVDFINRQARAMRGGLNALEAEAGSFGTDLDIGLVTIICALGYVDLRFGGDEWRSTRPTLAAWEAKMIVRPSVSESKPDPAANPMAPAR
jgi:glutathione S-transferase